MAMNIPWGFGFQRITSDPLDPSYVFDTLAEFQTYLTGGTAYAGQIVAVRNGTNVPDIYIVNNDKTSYSPLEGGGGGGRYEHEQTTAATQWDVEHNFGTKYVSAQVVDSAGNTIIPDIDWPASTNTEIKLIFATAKDGTCIVRR